MTNEQNKKPAIPEELAPEHLLGAYAGGYFPMSPSRRSQRVQWYEPDVRGVIPMDAFKVSKNTRRWMRNNAYECAFNRDFRGTMLACADRDSTWISDPIIEAYCALHELGHAHSVEIYIEGEAVGGLYGVSLMGAFFGESMFQREKDMAKVALARCHERLAARGFVLWDTQYYTPHLGTFGCREVSRRAYKILLDGALRVDAAFDGEPAFRASDSVEA